MITLKTTATAALLELAAERAGETTGVEKLLTERNAGRPALRIRRRLGETTAVGADIALGPRGVLQCQPLVRRLGADGPGWAEKEAEPELYVAALLATVELAAPHTWPGGYLIKTAVALAALGWVSLTAGLGRPDALLAEMAGVESHLLHRAPMAAGLHWVAPTELALATLIETIRCVAELAARAVELPAARLGSGAVVPMWARAALARAAA